MIKQYKAFKKLREQGYTIVEVIIVLVILVVLPLMVFWGWALIKLVLAAVGFIEANS